MSTSIFLSAIKPADETWKKHKAVWDACQAAGVSMPKETDDYFDGEPPDPDGVEVELGSMTYPKGAAERVEDEHYSVVRIDLKKLPEDIRYIKIKWG